MRTAYLRAAIDAESMLVNNYLLIPASERSKAIPPFCAPSESTTDQAERILSNYIAQNPQSTHLDVAVLLRFAFVKAWPCPY